jgi:hypothetical protein
MRSSTSVQFVVGVAALLAGALVAVFGIASLVDVCRDLLGSPQPAGKDYVLGPLLIVLAGFLIWRGQSFVRTTKRTPE